MSQAQKKFQRWKLTFQSLTPQSPIHGDLVPVLLWGPPELSCLDSGPMAQLESSDWPSRTVESGLRA